jgi:CelD/BcsL family acetyltransferase involved in cellulose biosynthesis
MVGLALRERWDVWELEELAPTAAAIGLPCLGSLDETIADQTACPVLPLRGADGLEDVPARKRRSLRDAVVAADRWGGMSIERADSDMAGFLDQLERLHRARWASRGERGLFTDDAVRQFHREAAAGLAQAGLARCYLMRIGTRVVAAYYGFFDRGRAYAYLTGFDPAFDDASPGSLVIAYAMRDARREGGEEFHFLRGQEPYKYTWGATDRWNRHRSLRRARADG